MKQVFSAFPVILHIMLLHLLRQARCFSSTAPPFCRPACRLTNEVGFSPAPRCATTLPSRPRTSLFSSTASGISRVIPITVLSGFLGSGKTTLLQHMLNNNEGLKIAVIVNDMASVNIDSKLVRGRTAASSGDKGEDWIRSHYEDDAKAAPAGMVELQNGCVCCSTSGELLSAVSELMTISDMRYEDESFDHIVIEMSGIGEPRSIRNMFQEAMLYDMPLMERVSLDTLVTVVDCSTYLNHLQSSKLANVIESPELFYRNEEERKEEERKKVEEDEYFWMDDMSMSLSEMLNDSGEGGYEGGICDLLVEQTEVADVVLLNKIDVGELEGTEQVVGALNPRAKTIATSFGKVERLSEILAVANGEGVAVDGVVDDHKEYVIAAEAQNSSDPDCTDQLTAQGCSHSHDHSCSHDYPSADEQSLGAADCNNPDCAEPDCTNSDCPETSPCSHNNRSSDESPGAADCADSDCTETSPCSHNDGSTDEELLGAANCADTDCAGISSYTHSDPSADEESLGVTNCANLDCTETSADCTSSDCAETSQRHSPTRRYSSDAATNAGIGSYVYRARRPFNPLRLLSILQMLPVVRGVPTVQSGDADGMDASVKKVFQRILRSKGFAWTADSNVKALYWSHAGSSFEMQCLGRWWATLPKQQWPEEAKDSILADFDSIDHDEALAFSATSTVGDRRQEIVLIGPGVGSLDSRIAIKSALDSCLLNNEEWVVFCSKRDDEASLAYFENPLSVRMMTF